MAKSKKVPLILLTGLGPLKPMRLKLIVEDGGPPDHNEREQRARYADIERRLKKLQVLYGLSRDDWRGLAEKLALDLHPDFRELPVRGAPPKWSLLQDMLLSYDFFVARRDLTAGHGRRQPSDLALAQILADRQPWKRFLAIRSWSKSRSAAESPATTLLKRWRSLSVHFRDPTAGLFDGLGEEYRERLLEQAFPPGEEKNS